MVVNPGAMIMVRKVRMISNVNEVQEQEQDPAQKCSLTSQTRGGGRGAQILLNTKMCKKCEKDINSSTMVMIPYMMITLRSG